MSDEEWTNQYMLTRHNEEVMDRETINELIAARLSSAKGGDDAK